MASLIPENGVIFNCADTAPPPSKDYCQVIVTWDQVMFRLWKIAIRNDVKPSPSETKDDYEDFLWDDRLHSEIFRCFGKNTLDYVKGLAEGHIDFLPRIPRHLLIHIFRFLPLEDLSRVATLSKMFRELCNSDELWEILYLDHMGAEHVGDELRSLAEAVGWKKLFFTNKLQLQMQLRRLALQLGKAAWGGEGVAVQSKTLAQLIRESELNAQWQVTSMEDDDDIQSEASLLDESPSDSLSPGPDQSEAPAEELNRLQVTAVDTFEERSQSQPAPVQSETNHMDQGNTQLQATVSADLVDQSAASTHAHQTNGDVTPEEAMLSIYRRSNTNIFGEKTEEDAEENGTN